MKEKSISLEIDSEVFKKLREDFNKMINATLVAMSEKNSSEGEISIKIDISTIQRSFPIKYTTEMKKITVPHFSHKVTSKISMKTEIQGKFEEDYQLVYDATAKKFVLNRIDDGQMTLFDTPENRDYEYDDPDDE